MKSNRGFCRVDWAAELWIPQPYPKLYFFWVGLRFAYLRSCITLSLILVWIEGSSTPRSFSILIFTSNHLSSYIYVCTYTWNFIHLTFSLDVSGYRLLHLFIMSLDQYCRFFDVNKVCQSAEDHQECSERWLSQECSIYRLFGWKNF